MSRGLAPLLKWASVLTVTAALSTTHAANVIDADSGELLYEQNADNPQHLCYKTYLFV